MKNDITKIPTLYEWAGGKEAFERLTRVFYDRVLKDEIIGPVFKNMSAEHSVHVAHFIAEVFGGPALYSDNQPGAHGRMVAHHLNKHLTEQQRKQWLKLLLEAADEVGLPDDPEFRSALVGYLEWGSRIAVLNSQADNNPVNNNEPMPAWGWGVPGKPYIP